MRDPEGRAGLLRAMEPMSEPESTSGGAEISKPLGFLAFGGRDGDLVLEPDDRFKGSRESESWQAASRKRLLCSEWRGELGDRAGRHIRGHKIFSPQFHPRILRTLKTGILPNKK